MSSTTRTTNHVGLNLIKGLSVPLAVSLTMACGGGETDPLSFSIAPGAYPTTQALTLVANDAFLAFPAAKIYVTTDGSIPTASPSCEYTLNSSTISLTKPRLVRVLYQTDGDHTLRGSYSITSGISNSGYTNRDVVDTWITYSENMADIVFATYPELLDPLPNILTILNNLYVIDDGAGGTATSIAESGYPAALSGINTFTYNGYSDPATGIQATAGTVVSVVPSVLSPGDNYYNTDESGATIVFNGTYNGSAEGSMVFANNKPTDGWFEITCSDAGCAGIPGTAVPVTYVVDPTVTPYELNEVNIAPGDPDWSCN